MTAAPHRPPRAFRRRLLLWMGLAVLVPILAWGVFTAAVIERLLSLSFAPIEEVLARVGEQPELPASLREDTHTARLVIAQAELARRALGRLTPRVLGALVILSLVAFAGAVLWIGRRLTRPVESLTSGMTRLAAGELEHRVPAPNGAPDDELAYLIAQFNRMGAELVLQRERLKSAEKLAAWQEVARAMAHELKNPLTAMRMALGRLGKVREGAASSEAVSESIALLQDEVDLLIRMTQSFTTYAQLPPPAPQSVSLSALVREVAALYRELPGGLEVEAPETLVVRADPDQLRRAVANLLKNAIEASASAPVKVTVVAEDSIAEVSIHDAGAGIGRILEGSELLRGLVSTKPGGSGLGLPIAAKIAVDHGGSLRLAPREGGGTVARLRIPRSRSG